MPDAYPSSQSSIASSSGTQLTMFPHTQLLEALVDLIKYWRWGRVIVVFAEPESNLNIKYYFVIFKTFIGIRRNVIFLENDAFASIRFHLVYVEAGDYLSAAKTVKEMEECDEVGRNQKKDFIF